MTKISKRLQAIASFVSLEDKIVDVGCDHGYLSIYLVENKLVSKVIASDINKNALQSAINNIKKKNLDIPTILSDGIKEVDLSNINTLVISGMGTATILHILDDDNKLSKINKLLIQSNNNQEILRRNMNNKGYYLENEIYTFDKGKWYVTSKFIKSNKKNTLEELAYGFLNNKKYNDYLLSYEKNIIDKVPDSSLQIKKEMIDKLEQLKKAIYDKSK